MEGLYVVPEYALSVNVAHGGVLLARPNIHYHGTTQFASISKGAWRVSVILYLSEVMLSLVNKATAAGIPLTADSKAVGKDSKVGDLKGTPKRSVSTQVRGGLTQPGMCAVDDDGDNIHLATQWQTPTQIALQYGIAVAPLLELNRHWYLTALHADSQLQTGTQIRLPLGLLHLACNAVAASTSFAKLAGTQLQRLVGWRCPHHGDCIQVCYSENCSTAWSCAVVHHGKKDADLELHFCDSTEVCRLDLDEDEWRFEKDGVDQDHQAARHGDRVAVFKHDEQRWYCGEVHTVADERRVEVRFDTIIAECELQVGCDVWLYECELGCKGRREALYHHFASSTS